MSTKTKLGKELVEYIENLPSASFKNKYGEKFVIHSNGIMVFMSGDEVREMVNDKDKVEDTYIDLFNPKFDVWSVDELDKLGSALKQVAKELRNGSKERQD